MALLSEDESVAELGRKLEVWYWNGVTWERVHWGVGVFGIACSASPARPSKTGGTRLFAVIATVCMGILGFANPQKRAGRYLQAYRLVDTALREYRCGLLSLQLLLTEHRRAEELLNEGDTHDPALKPP